jgi:hypothetical protein
MKPFLQTCLFLSASLTLASSFAAEPGTALKPDELKAEPFRDAPVVGRIQRGEALTLLERQSGWIRIRTASTAGWVRTLSVRRGVAGESSAADVQALAGVATGRAGTGRIVATTGVRGLGEAELKAARFDAQALAALESQAVGVDEARRFAELHGLVPRPLAWLPAPAQSVASPQE